MRYVDGCSNTHCNLFVVINCMECSAEIKFCEEYNNFLFKLKSSGKSFMLNEKKNNIIMNETTNSSCLKTIQVSVCFHIGCDILEVGIVELF